MPGATFIEGRTVDLKTIEREDLGFIHRGQNHPSIARFLSVTPTTMAEVEQMYEQQAQGNSVRLLIVPRDGEFADEPVGVIYMNPMGEDRIQGITGIWLIPEAQRNKYAEDACICFHDYAFNDYNLHRVLVKTSEQNLPVQRLCKRIGFTEEGRLRKREVRDGEYHDLLLYGQLASEWPGREQLLADVFD